MAMIEINKKPARRELNWFGALFASVFGLFAGLIWWRFDAPRVAQVIWVGAAAITVVYYSVPSLRRLLYIGWMYAVFPLGWTVSHLILVIVYYLVVTPTGLIMRLFGHDALQRRVDNESQSYWLEGSGRASPEARTYWQNCQPGHNYHRHNQRCQRQESPQPRGDSNAVPGASPFSTCPASRTARRPDERY